MPAGGGVTILGSVAKSLPEKDKQSRSNQIEMEN